jgi:formamidopyrimidine-DNA glycosylase
MPELPEVETTRLAISPYLLEETIDKIVTRHHQLRLPVSSDLQFSVGQKIRAIKRRAKYLLLHLSEGCLLIHLGMSGHLRIANGESEAGKHDHIDLQLKNGLILRYQDPRRFGLWLYLTQNPDQHPLLSHLGVEPLEDTFNVTYLFKRAHKKTQSIKSFIMNNEVVVGVGNIYATESLFLAGIHPLTRAGSIPCEKFEVLVNSIKKVLHQAITAGGTTLKDFYALDGKPGYFANELFVYGRKNQSCFRCATLIETVRIAGRNSAFCPGCQILD